MKLHPFKKNFGSILCSADVLGVVYVVDGRLVSISSGRCDPGREVFWWMCMFASYGDGDGGNGELVVENMFIVDCDVSGYWQVYFGNNNYYVNDVVNPIITDNLNAVKFAIQRFVDL